MLFRSTVRKWIAAYDGECSTLFRHLYDNAINIVEQASIPQLILILGEYQRWAPFVADQEINMVSAMVDIMSSVKFK